MVVVIVGAVVVRAVVVVGVPLIRGRRVGAARQGQRLTLVVGLDALERERQERRRLVGLGRSRLGFGRACGADDRHLAGGLGVGGLGVDQCDGLDGFRLW